MTSGTVKKIAKLSFSVLLLGYFFTRVDLSHTLSSIFSIPVSALAVSILIYIFSVWISAVKWRLLLPRYTVSELAKICLIGLYYNLIVPGQLVGEGIKGYYLIKKGDGRQVVASIVVDKITGLIGLLLVALGGTWLSGQIAVQGIAWVLTVITLSGIILLSALRNQRLFSFILGCVWMLGDRFPRLHGFSTHMTRILHDCKAYLQQPFVLIKAVAAGVLFQLSGVVIIWFMARGLQIQTPFADFCWIAGIVSIAILMPLTIGGIGVREGAFIGLLGQLGVAGEKALALSLAIFALQIFLAVAGGIIGLGINFKPNPGDPD